MIRTCLVVAVAALASDTRAGETFQFPGAKLANRVNDVDLADVNRDGLVDVLVASTNDGQALLYLATSPSTFAPAVPLLDDAPGAFPLAAVFSDLDGDERLDVVAIDHGSNSVFGSYQQPDGSFTSVALSGVLDDPQCLAAADVTGDGRPDALVGDGIEVRLFEGLAPMGFTSGQIVSASETVRAISTGDIDADGDIDFVTANAVNFGVGVALNTGGGSFPIPSTVPANLVRDVALEDMDGDGQLDIVRLSFAEVRTHVGAGDGTFGAPLGGPSVNGLQTMVVVDLDLDGDLDVVATQDEILGDGLVYSMRNDGSGTLAQPVGARGCSNPRAIAAADMNADGWPDVAVGTISEHELVFLQGEGDGTLRGTWRADTGDVNGPLLADFDLDGIPDALTQRDIQNLPVSVWRGRGNATFADPVEQASLELQQWWYPLAAGDVTGDGAPDAVLSFNTSSFNGLRVLPGQGDLSFAPGVDSSLGHLLEALVLEDVNADGDLDAVGLDLTSQQDQLEVFLGDGVGGFSQVSAVTLPAPSTFSQLALTDLDLDGLIDVGITTGTHGTIEFHEIDLTGQLSAATPLTFGFDPRALDFGDLDGDGLPDLAISAASGGALHMRLNQGGSTFGPSQLIAPSSSFSNTQVFVVDANADGVNEVITGTRGVMVLQQTAGPGVTFAEPRRFTGNYSTVGLADLDDDGLLDVVLGDFHDDVLVVLRNGLYGSWSNLGAALPAGLAAPPRLIGRGSMEPGELVQLRATGNAPFSAGWMVLGLSELLAPFKGGTLVPAPDLLLGGLNTDVDGALLISLAWPAGLPTGLGLNWQFWVADANGPAGFTATNGVVQVLP